LAFGCTCPARRCLKKKSHGHGASQEPASVGALKIEIQDNGAGFTPEIASKVPSPFYTTRNVGLGLGLTVTRKIIETHQGKLEIVPTRAGQSGLVRISLPVDTAAITAAAGKG
jgi:nitrogen fixation/metabolism regulation signal transduction histidine kinase